VPADPARLTTGRGSIEKGSPVTRSTLAAARVLAVVVALGSAGLAWAAAPVAAQDDVCSALTLEELRGALGTTFGEGFGFEGYCSWDATAGDESITVSIILEAGTLAELREQAPGGRDVTIAGLPAYAVDEVFDDELRAAAAAVEQGEVADALYIETTDPDLAILDAAVALMELAAPRLADMSISVEPESETSQPPACSIFDEAEVSEIVGRPLVETEYSDVSCTWETGPEATSFASASLSYDTSDLSEVRMFYPGGEDRTVADVPGYLYTFEMEGSTSAALAVDLGVETATISVVSPDPSFDAASAATRMMETALQRGLVAGPEPSTGPGACAALGADEVAGALGLQVQLEVVDFGDSCSYFADEPEAGIDIVISIADPETIGFEADSLGAEPIDGIGDEAWWAAGYGTLFARAGDAAYSVFVGGSGGMTDESRADMARTLMGLLLAQR
jgi:hypothetical protein